MICTLSVRTPPANAPLTTGATVPVLSPMSTVPVYTFGPLDSRFPYTSYALISMLNPVSAACCPMFPPPAASTVK